MFSNPIVNSLIITAIGMGLVFVAILLLWGVMEALVRLTADRAAPQPAEAGPEPPAGDQRLVKQRAAAAAVAVALALHSRQLQFPEPAQTGELSAWQAVRRAGLLNQRSATFTRKPRGNTQ